MLAQLKKLIRLNLDDFYLLGGVVGGVFLLIHIVTALGVRLSGEGSSLLLSGVVLPIVAGVLILIVTVSHVGLTFVQALQFGQTRRRALGLTLGLAGFESLGTLGLAALLNLLERAAAPGFWLWLSGRDYIAMDAIPPIPERGWTAGEAAFRAQQLFIEDFSLDWWWFPLIALGAVAAGIIFGAILQRFGGRGAWVLWIAWMAVILSPQLLPWKRFAITNWLFPLMGVMAAAALVWSLWSLLHAVVKA